MVENSVGIRLIRQISKKKVKWQIQFTQVNFGKRMSNKSPTVSPVLPTKFPIEI